MFVIFLYDKIQWTYGIKSEGIPAQVDTYDIVWLSDLLSWVGGGLDWWDTFNLLIADKGPCIYTMGNALKCVNV